MVYRLNNTSSKNKRYVRKVLLFTLAVCILGIMGVLKSNHFHKIKIDITHGQRIVATPMTVIPDNANKSKVDIQPQPKPASNYGIAAGGKLTFLNQADLNNYFSQLKLLGVTWIRWDIDWSEIQQKSSNEYNWQSTDRVVQTAKTYEIQSLGIITYTPKWARPVGCNMSDKCAPANPAAFAKFAGTVANRYASKVDNFEIWNEPNYADFWQPIPNAAEYSRLLAATYAQIKLANPRAQVLSGGLAAAGDDSGNISPLTFITRLYELKANQYYDSIALHPYSYPALPSYIATWNRWQQIELIHNLMVTNGDGAKKIWITEYGAPTGGPGSAHSELQLINFAYNSDYMTEQAQNNLMVDAITSYKLYSSWTGPFFWYSLQDNGSSKDNTENFFGLSRYDNSRKQAYFTFQKAIKQPLN